jgi:3-mercaptopyruvate sulfurtransferase SseA
MEAFSMRKAVTLVAACALVTGVAAAQMKVKPSAPVQKAPLSVQGAQQQPQQPNLDAIRRISTSEALKLANRGEAVIVDVRSNESFTLGHIRGAYSIPGSQLLKRLKELPMGKMIITYCA